MRIAIVNDVVLAVEAMRRVLVHARNHQIAWIAYDGSEAVALCAKDRPDLILMDLLMPGMDGIAATRRIMAESPCAIVVVTADVSRNSSKVFEAMGAGALDAVNTPVLGAGDHPGGSDALLAKIDTIARLLNGRSTTHHHETTITPHRGFSLHGDHLIAIGASAGGPAALAKIISSFPADFPASIVIVQHVDAQFAPGLAHWLDQQTELRVRLAQEGDCPRPGTVLLAGRDSHLVFSGPSRLGYTRHPIECSYRPSIDVFFKSIQRHWRGDVIGVLLTGMGRDGAEGLKSLRDTGHSTIAQDEATSAVYGMPKAAAALDAATEILPLNKIAPRLARLLASKVRSHA